MNRFVAPFAAAILAAFAVTAAAAGEGWEVDVSAGAAWSSYDSGVSVSAEDVYGTTTSNDLGTDPKTSWGFGAAVRYIEANGIGVELLAERAGIDLDGKTGYSLDWMSVLGPQSESYQFHGDGSLDLTPVSLNLVGRTMLGERFSLTGSAGVTLEWISLSDESKVGLVTYVGDSIETFAADSRISGSATKWTWNAGASADYAITGGLAVVFDARYYGNAGARPEKFEVRPGTYDGLHLGQPVELDPESAAAASAKLREAASSNEIDTAFFRASVGLRFRF